MVELHADLRGYPLLGREFYLKEPIPRKTRVITLDGTAVEGEYYVVALKEFLRVVPEAKDERFGSDEVFIPTFVARRSFRPGYHKA